MRRAGSRGSAPSIAASLPGAHSRSRSGARQPPAGTRSRTYTPSAMHRNPRAAPGGSRCSRAGHPRPCPPLPPRCPPRTAKFGRPRRRSRLPGKLTERGHRLNFQQRPGSAPPTASPIASRCDARAPIPAGGRYKSTSRSRGSRSPPWPRSPAGGRSGGCCCRGSARAVRGHGAGAAPLLPPLLSGGCSVSGAARSLAVSQGGIFFSLSFFFLSFFFPLFGSSADNEHARESCASAVPAAAPRAASRRPGGLRSEGARAEGATPRPWPGRHRPHGLSCPARGRGRSGAEIRQVCGKGRRLRSPEGGMLPRLRGHPPPVPGRGSKESPTGRPLPRDVAQNTT